MWAVLQVQKTSCDVLTTYYLLLTTCYLLPTGAEDVVRCTDVGLSLAVALRVPAANGTVQDFFSTVVVHDRAGNTRSVTSAGLRLLRTTMVSSVAKNSSATLMQTNCTQVCTSPLHPFH